MYRRRKSGRHLRSSHYPYYKRYTPHSPDYFYKDDDLYDMRRAKAGPVQANPRYVHTCDVCKIVCTSAYQLDEHLLGMKHKSNAEENVSTAEAENTSVELEKLDSPEHSEEYASEEKSEDKDSALAVIQTNKELYQFLEYYEVASDSDVSFILKVAKGFRCALQRFKGDHLGNEVCQEAVPSSERSFSGGLPIATESSTEPTNSEAYNATNTPMESESMSLEDLVPTCSDEEES